MKFTESCAICAMCQTSHIDQLISQHIFNAITFLDRFQGIPANFYQYGHSVVFASPSFLESQDANTSFDGWVTYIPLWTKDEMDEYQSLCQTDPFNGWTVDDLYRLYSGCIGLATSMVQKVMDDLYVKAVAEHVEKYRENEMAVLVPGYVKRKWSNWYHLTIIKIVQKNG